MTLSKLTNSLNSVIFYLCLGLFIFIPLYPKYPLLNISGTFVAVRLEDIFIALTIGLWAIFIVLSSQVKILIKDNINRLILLFFFIGIVSTFSAIFLTHTVVPHLGIIHFFRRVEFILLLPVVAAVINSKKRLIITLITLTLVLLLVNIYALGQQYLDWPVISTTNSEFSKGLSLRLTPGARVNSTFAGHYDLAVFLAIALVLITALFFAAGKLFKIWIALLGGLSLLVLMMTAARISFVAAFVGIVSSLLFVKKKKYLLLIFIFSILILLYPSQLRDRFVSTITVNFLNLGQRYSGKNLDQNIRSKLNIPTVAYKTSSHSASISSFASPSGQTATDITPGEPIDTTQLGVYRSFQIRLDIEWPRAINAFLKNPLLGTGYSSLGIATDNDFLRSLGEIGLLGTIAFILILVACWKKIAKGLRNDDKWIRFFSAGSLSVIIAFLVNGTFIDVFEASKVASLFWMLLGLNLGILKD